MPRSASSLRLTRPEPREADVLASVLEYLQKVAEPMGLVVWHARMNSGLDTSARPVGGNRFVRYGFRGCPDILGQLPGGRLLALECKRPTGRLSREQKAFLAKARDGGALAEVVRSVDEVDRLVRGGPDNPNLPKRFGGR